ncbi:phosphatidate cytidylyltransferase [Aquabacterium commune]|uniref:Phosphatidate cytidylyltransferase n=1 Tax=Aquabacterium commune TaxID=70586 RepID=A0A4R6REH6_9BURK|nr:phosphatidate cytidylyltransferase [Aquabacterium commune]TDP84620.1 phosphatidate cytidylyltransferase [Aquabacterium commune]
MLKQRVITGLILLAILLPTLLAEAAWPFALLTLVFISAAGWEWSRLNEAPGARAWLLGAAVAGACVYVAHAFHLPLWGNVAQGVTPHVHAAGHALVGFIAPAEVWLGSTLLWVVGGALALRWGPTHWLQVPQGVRRLLGLALLVLAWMALVESRAQGLNYLLSVFCLVWGADIGAYFGGRAFGKHKLAPSISPGKSREGVVAGMAAVLLLAAGWLVVDQQWAVDSPSLYSRLQWGLGVPGMVLALLALAGLSVVGDLFESLIKRQAGAKDSSQLLPGHGGVLDRIDALLPVLPVSLALMTLCHG